MLASVKEGLYHPMLPTFRRMDMDTAMHRLPEEHSRTTTPLTRGTMMQIEEKVIFFGLQPDYEFRFVF